MTETDLAGLFFQPDSRWGRAIVELAGAGALVVMPLPFVLNLSKRSLQHGWSVYFGLLPRGVRVLAGERTQELLQDSTEWLFHDDVPTFERLSPAAQQIQLAVQRFFWEARTARLLLDTSEA